MSEGRNIHTKDKITSPSGSESKGNRRVLLFKDPHHKSGIRTPIDEKSAINSNEISREISAEK